jgi:hypothetical protein
MHNVLIWTFHVRDVREVREVHRRTRESYSSNGTPCAELELAAFLVCMRLERLVDVAQIGGLLFLLSIYGKRHICLNADPTKNLYPVIS